MRSSQKYGEYVDNYSVGDFPEKALSFLTDDATVQTVLHPRHLSLRPLNENRAMEIILQDGINYRDAILEPVKMTGHLISKNR